MTAVIGIEGLDRNASFIENSGREIGFRKVKVNDHEGYMRGDNTWGFYVCDDCESALQQGQRIEDGDTLILDYGWQKRTFRVRLPQTYGQPTLFPW